MTALTFQDMICLHKLRREIEAGERSEHDPDRRLGFARWLYQHGYINDGTSTLCPCGYKDDPCPCVRDERVAHEMEATV